MSPGDGALDGAMACILAWIVLVFLLSIIGAALWQVYTEIRKALHRLHELYWEWRRG